MSDEHTMPVPPGLTRCPVCGEYRGSTLAGHLTWNEPLDASEIKKRADVLAKENSNLTPAEAFERAMNENSSLVAKHYAEREMI